MIMGTVRQFMNRLSSQSDRANLSGVIEAIADRMSSQPHRAAGLVIKTGGSTLAKTGSTAWYGTANGDIVTIAGSTDMPALTGLVITATKFNVACFFIDNAATVTAVFGTEGATANAVAWPQFPVKKAYIGSLLITHSSTFTGGTTALDTATTVYLDGYGAFDPTIVLGT